MESEPSADAFCFSAHSGEWTSIVLRAMPSTHRVLALQANVATGEKIQARLLQLLVQGNSEERKLIFGQAVPS
jgi:hypothetical protein